MKNDTFRRVLLSVKKCEVEGSILREKLSMKFSMTENPETKEN